MEVKLLGKVVEITSRAPRHQDWIVVMETAPLTYASITVGQADLDKFHLGGTYSMEIRGAVQFVGPVAGI